MGALILSKVGGMVIKEDGNRTAVCVFVIGSTRESAHEFVEF